MEPPRAPCASTHSHPPSATGSHTGALPPATSRRPSGANLSLALLLEAWGPSELLLILFGAQRESWHFLEHSPPVPGSAAPSLPLV